MAVERRASLADLPLEIFPVIVDHLPLYLTPQTVLSLSLTNHQIGDRVLPLLYSYLVLRNEKEALSVIKYLLDNPGKGRIIRGIHLTSIWRPFKTRRSSNELSVLEGLKQLVTMGAFPGIRALELYLVYEDYDPYDDDHPEETTKNEDLKSSFWRALKEQCPNLHTLRLTDMGYAKPGAQPWMDESEIFEIKSIETLYFTSVRNGFDKTGYRKFMGWLTSLSLDIRTLNVAFGNFADTGVDLAAIFDLTFPLLTSFSVFMVCIDDSSNIIPFWKRHPALENISVYSEDECEWFPEDFKACYGLLPKLNSLAACFKDIRKLAPILGQLTYLTIYKSINAQALYLLRQLVPSGRLHSLKSLYIEQTIDCGDDINTAEEGSRWYESLDDEFCETTNGNHGPTFRDGMLDECYMRSLVRAAPNLEELSLDGEGLTIFNYSQVIPDLAKFRNLRRFCLKGEYDTIEAMTNTEKEQFKSAALLAATHCHRLGAIASSSYPVDVQRWGYVSARITRDEAGKVENVDLKMGPGRVMGEENEAFP